MEPKEETEGWVQAPYREDEEGQEVPGALVYLPVTILRPTGREVSLSLLLPCISCIQLQVVLLLTKP